MIKTSNAEKFIILVNIKVIGHGIMIQKELYLLFTDLIVKKFKSTININIH